MSMGIHLFLHDKTISIFIYHNRKRYISKETKKYLLYPNTSLSKSIKKICYPTIHLLSPPFLNHHLDQSLAEIEEMEDG